MRLLLCLFFLLAACGANPYSTVSDEELHAKAKSLTLPQRYDLYVNVLHSRIPSRPILADDIAVLGPGAWKYVLESALSGGSEELLNALPVLVAFDRRCTPRELDLLREHARRVSGANAGEELKSSIETLCGADLPASD
jgi:hypothetical protein